MVERWLGYDERVRRVVFQPAPKLIPAPPPKNVLIQWDSPDVALQTEFKFLGVAAANPAEYAAKYGATLVEESQLPALAVNHFKPPAGETLGAHFRPKLPKLVGDLHALSLINLDAHGLAAYKQTVPAPLAVEPPAAAAASVVAAEAVNYETTYGSGFASTF